MSNWHNIDREWAGYWSNGPEQVAKALTTPATPVYECRSLNDMDAKEIEAIEAEYNCKVLPPAPEVSPDESATPDNADDGDPNESQGNCQEGRRGAA